jgi:putative ABC transport system permease protein
VRILRNVFRRKLRAFLTISGITIGVFALVVMGSMAEKINLLVEGGSKWYGDKVTVTDASVSNACATAPVSIEKIPEIEGVDGVAAASGSLSLMLDEEGGMSFGMPAMIMGTDMRGAEFESFEVKFSEGRDLKPGERGVVVVGSDLVQKLDAEVGRDITLRGKPFEVVGIMEKTLTAPDTTVAISLADAQELFFAELPAAYQAQVKAETLATGITVYLDKGRDPEQMAKDVQAQVSGIKAYGPKMFEEQVASGVRIFNAIIFGVALISLLVGGLSVINTMTMSVLERIREIGIRKAVGASHGQIIRQFLAESATIGFIGGAAGLVLGWVFVYLANAAGNASGTELFLLTLRLALGSVAFALFLGTLSGLYPAWHAARMHPVVALRHE